MIYSPKQDKFYAPELKESYLASETWPDDGVEISHDIFKEFSSVKDGFYREYQNGKFSWVELFPTQESLISSEKLWRDGQLRLADEELNKVQDADPKSYGTVAGWRQYRKDLRAWPENPSFPNSIYRPKYPT